jgi:hypothetical protein
LALCEPRNWRSLPRWAPFLGLFGKVWGIMSSFSGIAQRQDTSLAVVAPGNAETLASYGLPAASGYNGVGAASPNSTTIMHYARANGIDTAI